MRRFSALKFYRADVSNRAALGRIFRKHKIEAICHLAAQVGVRHSVTHPFEYEHWNSLGTLNLLDWSRKCGVRRFVLASSSSVYGLNRQPRFAETQDTSRPLAVYAATKKTTELYAHVYQHLFGLHCTALRLFTVYGPWGRPDMALFRFTRNLLAGKPIEVYNQGRMQRDFTYIDDAVAGILKALRRDGPFEIINIGSGRPERLNAVIRRLEGILGQKARRKLMPLQPGDVTATRADIRKAGRLLGYHPRVTLQQGLLKFVAWFTVWQFIFLLFVKYSAMHYLLQMTAFAAALLGWMFVRFFGVKARWPRLGRIAAACLGLYSLTMVYTYPMKSNHEQLAKIQYILEHTTGEDRVYDGRPEFNLFRRDLHYFWYSVGTFQNLWVYQKLTGKYQDYDIRTLILDQSPKFISDFQVLVPEGELKKRYEPTPFESLFRLRPEFRSNGQHD